MHAQTVEDARRTMESSKSPWMLTSSWHFAISDRLEPMPIIWLFECSVSRINHHMDNIYTLLSKKKKIYTYLSNLSIYLNLSILFIYLSIYLSVCLCVYLPTYSIYLHIYLFIYLSVIYLAVYHKVSRIPKLFKEK
jgi:hypothetical protein